MKAQRLIGVAVASAALACGGAAQSGPASAPAAEARKPVLHLVAPPYAYSWKYDPLAAEAALRLLAYDLAARHNILVRYWPVDQVEKMPADAWPRLRLAAVDRPETIPQLRLRRRGDEFQCLASADGKDYFQVYQRTMKMPRKVYVGVHVSSLAKAQRSPFYVTMNGLRLNGQPFKDYERAELGRSYDPAVVKEDEEGLKVRTVGTRIRRDYRGVGPFLYKIVEGDFEMDATVVSMTPKDYFRWAGVFCRPSLDLMAPTIGVATEGGGGYAMEREWPVKERMAWLSRDGAHVLAATLARAPGQEKTVARVPLSWSRWEDLTESIGRLSDAMKAGVAAELGWKLGAPAAAAPAGAADLQALAAARAQALLVTPPGFVAAARDIDALMNRAPACPQAHRAAAHLGAIVACQDVYGNFQDRGRTLAPVVAHWVLAERLAPAAAPEDKLAGAWTAFVCGYPNAAAAMLPAPAGAAMSPEERALRAYITRDYRPWPDDTVLKAPPIEQLAWLWTVQQCARPDLTQTFAPRIVAARKAGAFVPHNSTNIIKDEDYVLGGLLPAFGHDAVVFLTDARLPEDVRRAAGRAMADALGAEKVADLPTLARNIEKRVASEGFGTSMPEALAGLVDLYLSAAAQPVAPLAAGPGIEWRCLGPHDFAALQRGFLMKLLYREIQDMRPKYGDEATTDFCDQAATGLARIPFAETVFKEFRVGVRRSAEAMFDKYKAETAGPLTSPLDLFAMLLGARYMLDPLETGEELPFFGARGVWQWNLQVEMAWSRGARQDGFSAGRSALQVDDYDTDPVPMLCWVTAALGCTEALKARMPYDYRLAREMARFAPQYAAPRAAADGCEQMVRLRPGLDAGLYANLAQYKSVLGDRRGAIEVGKRAAAECEPSETVSALLGRTAEWLVEEGDLKEALEWGERAAEGGAAEGRRGHALALAANGKPDQADTIFRDLAAEDPARAGDYLQSLLARGRKPADALKDLDQVVPAAAPDGLSSAADSVARSFLVRGDPQVLEQAYGKMFAFAPAPEQSRNLMLAALRARQFDLAVRHAKALEKAAPLSAEEVVFAHTAARLARQPEDVTHFTAVAAALVPDKTWGWHMRFVTGQADAELLLFDGNNVPFQNERFTLWYAHFLVGADADVKGDRATAIREYREACAQAGAVPTKMPVQWIAKAWIEALEKAPATRPISRPAGGGVAP